MSTTKILHKTRKVVSSTNLYQWHTVKSKPTGSQPANMPHDLLDYNTDVKS